MINNFKYSTDEMVKFRSKISKIVIVIVLVFLLLFAAYYW